MQALWSQPHHTSRGTACAPGAGWGLPSTHLVPQRVSAHRCPPGWAGTCMHQPSPQRTFHGVTRSPAPVTFPDVTSAPCLLPRASCGRDFSQVFIKAVSGRTETLGHWAGSMETGKPGPPVPVSRPQADAEAPFPAPLPQPLVHTAQPQQACDCPCS